MTKIDDTLQGARLDPLVTPQQLADYLQISRATIQRHITRGMPHERLGASIRFKLDDVMSWLRNQASARANVRKQRARR